MEDID